MCVICAVKLPRDRKTGKPKDNATWRLAKIRDRTYTPEFKIKRWTVKDNGSSQLFLVDQDTEWTEGVSVDEDGTFLGMINAALNNYTDKKDDGSKSKKSSSTGSVSSNGIIIRNALRCHNIDNCVEHLASNKLDGNTIITDGNRLFVVESYISKATKEKYAKIKGDKRYEDIIPAEEYTTVIKEIDDEDIVVRTNHGIFDENAGYTKDDGDSYVSSSRRRDYALKAIKQSVFEPIDLITELSKLSSKEIDKNAFYRPIRVKGEAKSKDSDVEIFSTAIIMLDPSGVIFLKPIDCDISNVNIHRLMHSKYLTNLVVLPARTPLFENVNSFKGYVLIDNILGKPSSF